jgi:hypothetical protein
MISYKFILLTFGRSHHFNFYKNMNALGNFVVQTAPTVAAVSGLIGLAIVPISAKRYGIYAGKTFRPSFVEETIMLSAGAGFIGYFAGLAWPVGFPLLLGAYYATSDTKPMVWKKHD